MLDANAALTLAAVVLLVLGVTAGLIKARWYVSEPVVALVVGAAVGPAGLGWFDLARWGPPLLVLEQIARVTLALAIMDVALCVPTAYLRRDWRSVATLIGVLMPCMGLVGAVLAKLTLGVSLAVAALLGALLMPTDPVLASAIVSGRLANRCVPERVRHTILAEAGANDALALPFVSVALLALGPPTSGDAFLTGILHAVLVETLGGAAIGLLAGLIVASVLKRASRHRDADRTPLLTVSLALSLALLGGSALIGVNGLLAIFVAGVALNAGVHDELIAEKERLHEAARRFFELPAFMLFGLALPLGAWLGLGWRVAVFALALLVLRRLPATLLLRRWLPALARTRDLWFAGWFGPMGVAAIYYGASATLKSGNDTIWTVASFAIVASIFAFGVSGTAATKWLGSADGSRCD